MNASVAAGFTFTSTGETSADLTDAFARYQALTFPHP